MTLSRAHRRSRRAALLLSVLAATVIVGHGGRADAHTATADKPVLLVHGYNATSNSTDCGGAFDSMIDRLRNEGFTGPMIKVGFYSGDTNCDVNLRSYGSFGNSDSWKTVAKAFSQYVYREYTSRGITVDVVGYSMGGLIARGGIWGSQKGDGGFAPPIDVEDAVTLGTPHTGAAWYSNACLWGQCRSLRPGASEFSWLNQDRNPQGRYGTEWTTIGSPNDWVAPLASATAMSLPAEREPVFNDVSHMGLPGDYPDYMHSDEVVSRSASALLWADS
jgi:triacylglycerol esterase/lipase EstA (alpha/beta hydrolase family)